MEIFFFFVGNDNSNDKNYEINNANTLCEYMIILNVLIVNLFLLRNHVFKKKTFQECNQSTKQFRSDQVPYFVGPDLGQKCLQSSRYHEQS